MPSKLPFLRVEKTRIVDEADKPVTLKGVAPGGQIRQKPSVGEPERPRHGLGELLFPLAEREAQDHIVLAHG